MLSRHVATLDAVGNPLQVVRSGSLSQTETYTYDGLDRLTDVCFQGQECGRERGYLARMRAFDPVLYVGHAAPAALLVQNGTSDEYWPRREMVRLQAAVSRPKTVRWYDATHALNEAAERDRSAWLAKRLGLSP